MKKYCGLCGKKTIRYNLEGFDEKTGKRNFKMICPDETCVAGCEDRGGHFWEKYGDGWLEFMWKSLSNKCLKCKKCKEEVYGGFY